MAVPDISRRYADVVLRSLGPTGSIRSIGSSGSILSWRFRPRSRPLGS